MLPVAITFVLIIAGMNLKGVKESGKAFAIPTSRAIHYARTKRCQNLLYQRRGSSTPT